jgi:hypothetical protein
MRASTAGKVHYRREVRLGLYPPLLLPLELVLLPLLVVKLRKETSQPRSRLENRIYWIRINYT